MKTLARHPKAIFLGQSVKAGGTAMSATFRDVPADKLLELPVFENTQLGMSTGMALAGWLPVSAYSRWPFLLEASSQLVQHLDRIPMYSCGGYKPRVIIRTAIPTPEPLDPGPQHLGDFTDAFRLMLKTVRVVRLYEAEDIVPEYQQAMERDGSTILVELTGKYT